MIAVWLVVVVLLAEWVFPTTENLGLNPLDSNSLEHSLL